MPRWVVDKEAVLRAHKILKLEEPAKVIKKPGWFAGIYYPLHVIWVHPRFDKHDVSPSFTIWHELAHALQCERDFDCDVDAFHDRVEIDYAELLDDDGEPTGDDDAWYDAYEAIEWEQEANAIARKYCKKIPLIKVP